MNNPGMNAYFDIKPTFRETAVTNVNELSKRIIGNVEKAIVGKRRQLILSLVSWLAGGHILLEDVPGVAKTMLARDLRVASAARSNAFSVRPTYFPPTSPVPPCSIPKDVQFEFRPGPVFTQILLADEINRAAPRSQSALLEAMAEARVSVDGVTHVLEQPFLVIATQNPIDHEGTFPLPRRSSIDS